MTGVAVHGAAFHSAPRPSGGMIVNGRDEIPGDGSVHSLLGDCSCDPFVEDVDDGVFITHVPMKEEPE